MQEFTIKTDTNSTPSKEGSAESPRQGQTIQQEVNKKALGVETSSPPAQPPVTQPSGKQVQSRKRGSNLPIIFLGILFLVIIIVAGIFGYLYFYTKEESEGTGSDESATVTDLPDTGEESEDSKLKDTIFYADRYNIFQAGKDGSDQIQLTDYDNSGIDYISEVELINGQYIGFYRCETVTGDFGCKIYTLSISTKVVDVVGEIDPDKLLDQLTWVGVTEYAYAISYYGDTGYHWVINYVKDGINKQISKFSVEQPGGRGGFIEDDLQLKFSQEKDKIYYINTSGKEGFDFTVYVYDLEGNLLDSISDATMPVWGDNDTIIYRKYSNSEAGYLYKRDITSKQSEKIGRSTEAAYGPQVLGDNLLFWEASNTGTSYLLDLEVQDRQPFEGDTTFPVWLSEDEVILAKTKKCGEDECNMPGTTAFETQFTVEDFYVVNIETGEETKIEVDPEVLQGGIGTGYHKHL